MPVCKIVAGTRSLTPSEVVQSIGREETTSPALDAYASRKENLDSIRTASLGETTGSKRQFAPSSGRRRAKDAALA
jgi:hypothetical protein